MKYILILLNLVLSIFVSGSSALAETDSRACVVVADEMGRQIKDTKITSVKIGNGVGENTSIKNCVSGRPGTTFAITVYAEAFYRSTVIVELDEYRRTRVVQLRPGLLELRSSKVHGRVECATSTCVVRLMQVDGEHVYTADVTGGRMFEVAGPRPGTYVVVLNRDGVVPCVVPIIVKVDVQNDIELDFKKCARVE